MTAATGQPIAPFIIARAPARCRQAEPSRRRGLSRRRWGTGTAPAQHHPHSHRIAAAPPPRGFKPCQPITPQTTSCPQPPPTSTTNLGATEPGADPVRRDGTPARDHSTAPRRWDGSSTPGPVWSQHYLDLCRIFLLLRFSLRIRFLRHLALMAAHSRRA